MSRIYEALLRAEQDRAGNEKEAREGKAPAAPAAAGAQAPVVAPVIPVVPPPVELPVVPQASKERSDISAPARVAAAQLEQTPASPVALAPAPAIALRPAEELAGHTVTWQPDASRLPSLESRGAHVEQFRSLRSRLFEFRNLNKLQCILVSSGLPSEGKSFVAANLAVSFARHKATRVLLIDGDLRRSSQHKILGAQSEPGLGEYLAGKVALSEILQHGTKADGTALASGLSTLTFIPAGDAGDKAADLSGSPRFAELIATLTPQFDWIVVDSSPVNLVTDAVNLARACDGVLLIARAGVTKYEVAQRAITELKASNILGIVLNAVPDSELADGYYGYYGYDRLIES